MGVIAGLTARLSLSRYVVVAAVCATLPGASPADRAAVQAMVGGPPTEFVGLEPYDPRLLPMANSGGERP